MQSNPEAEELKGRLEKAMNEKDIQEVAELIFEIKAKDYHLKLIDIR